MKYFEVNEPYYAMVKAKNEEEAIRTYIECVADDEDGNLKEGIQELNREYALVKFSQTLCEGSEKMLPVNNVLEEFYLEGNQVLIIDGTLL